MSEGHSGNMPDPDGARLPSDEERVHGDIVKAIYEQRLRPGTKLGEEALAAAFGQPREDPARAFVAFQQKLVELIPNRGAFVIRPSESDARDVFTIRKSLENIVVERVAAKPDPAVIRQLRAHVRAEIAARDKGQRREAIRMAGEFHIMLARLSDSRVFLGTLEPVLMQSSLIVSLYGGGLVPSCPVEEHQAIVDALAQGDGAAACACMGQHLAHLEGTLRLELDDDEEPDFAAIFS
ncbi:GntR family transcriptional regulator [Paracoccus cavernae]|uniref:GntR family transcriptional regulator n=1 Tax=Paracoccus cavernae TaxID=1571207 RepID=A0ABT8D5B4_9RHOB|nr:GntR family transcriptional regulator [Paracoccus cavernae]